MNKYVLFCVVILALCASTAAAQGAPPISDSMTVYDPLGAIFAQTVAYEGNEDINAIYTVAVGVDTSQFGYATTLLELDGSYSDIFGVASVNGAYFLAFSSDLEGIPTPYGGQGFYFLPEGNGVFDATMYLDPVLQAQGYTAVFMSDSEVPEPASLLLMGTGLVGLAGVVRRKFNL